MSAFHEVTLAWFIVCIALGVALRALWSARKAIRDLREQLDVVWDEYERVSGLK